MKFKAKENETEERRKETKKSAPAEPPKTELEIKVAESILKKPEEKKDLFKAIFCDSDDEDDDEKQSQDDTEVIKKSNTDVNDGSSTLTEKQKSTFIESFLNTKSASEINVLRNASPPRGIFKSIFELGTSVSKMSANEKQKDTDKTNESISEETYGPALPANISNITNNTTNSTDDSSSSDSSLDEKLLKKLKKVKSSSKEKEKWVEKDKVKKSKKHHKKKKSHKKSHKKHKSKK